MGQPCCYHEWKAQSNSGTVHSSFRPRTAVLARSLVLAVCVGDCAEIIQLSVLMLPKSVELSKTNNATLQKQEHVMTGATFLATVSVRFFHLFQPSNLQILRCALRFAHFQLSHDCKTTIPETLGHSLRGKGKDFYSLFDHDGHMEPCRIPQSVDVQLLQCTISLVQMLLILRPRKGRPSDLGTLKNSGT